MKKLAMCLLVFGTFGCGESTKTQSSEEATCMINSECEAEDTDGSVGVCVEGVCKSRGFFQVRAADFSISCEVPGDCKLISEGEICQPCPCPTLAVNAADYDSQVEPPECGYENIACNNCPMPDLDCFDNVCVTTEPQ